MTERIQYQIVAVKPDTYQHSIERLYFQTETLEETECWETIARRIIHVMTIDRGVPAKRSPYYDMLENLSIMTIVSEE